MYDRNYKKFTYVTDLPFKDYFFATGEEMKALKEEYPDTDLEFELMENAVFVQFKKRNEPVYKVHLPSPYIKTKMRLHMEQERGILLSEADTKYIELVMKELGIKAFVTIQDGKVLSAEKPDGFPEPRIAFADYETDDRESVLSQSVFDTFAKPDVARILSCSVTKMEDGSTKHFRNEEEFTLLYNIYEELKNYEVIYWWNGYNFDDQFDLRYRINEIKGYDPNQWIRLDAMIIHEMLNNKERGFLSLDMMGKRYLGMRKIKHKWSFYEAFSEYPEELEVYNNRDTILMYKLEKMFGFGGIVLQTAEQIGFLPQKYTYSRYSSIIAIMNMSMNHYGKRFIWKSKSSIPLDDKYEGALVLDSIAGRWKNVIGIDLASLYNNIIQTWNISNEQLFLYKDGTHDYSRYDQEGIMPKALRMFEIEREKYKKLRNGTKDDKLYKLYDQIQGGLKIVLLSIYGGLGARGSKTNGVTSGAKSFYSWHCANDVTRHAREIISMAKEIVERSGYKVVYGDTDSLYIYIGDDDLELDDAKRKLEEIVDEINFEYSDMMQQDNVPDHRRKIKMEAQGWYSPFVLFGKKKYYFAKEVYNAENDKVNDDLKIYSKGVKMIKLSEPEFVREFQKDIYTDILNYKPYSEFKHKWKSTYEKFMNGEFDNKLVFETKLSKNIDEYVNKPPHIVLAEQLIRSGKMAEKSTIFYTIGHTYNGTAIAYPEGEPITTAGRIYFWEHRVQGWLDEIENLIYVSEIQTQLDDFF